MAKVSPRGLSGDLDQRGRWTISISFGEPLARVSAKATRSALAKALSFSKTQNLPSGYASTVLKRCEFSR